ncbi:MAG TPA: hypothetical protein VNS81_06755 [Nocardioides sp.]|nr:hypothetical protein [Nocardioides sp.]
MQRDEPADDAAWRAIVDNYGDPVLGDEPDPEPQPRWEIRPAPLERDDEGDEPLDDADEGFVPPTPPPLPRPTPDRMIAWTGLFAAPFLVLVFVIAGVHPPRLVGWALVLWFLGGFGYLVATMRAEPREPWDDGAAL